MAAISNSVRNRVLESYSNIFSTLESSMAWQKCQRMDSLPLSRVKINKYKYNLCGSLFEYNIVTSSKLRHPYLPQSEVATNQTNEMPRAMIKKQRLSSPFWGGTLPPNLEFSCSSLCPLSSLYCQLLLWFCTMVFSLNPLSPEVTC